MLNEWSDRVPPQPKRPLLLRSEFWLGCLSTLVGIGLVADLLARLLG